MEQDKPDLWTLGTNPCSITSFLTLNFIDGHLADHEKPTLTKNCGLGWRFQVSVASDEDDLEAPIFTISLSPHLVTAASIPNLRPNVKYSRNLRVRTLHNHSIELPTQLQYVPLESFTTTENLTGRATIDVTLSLPTSFSLSLASEPPTTKVQKALSSQLNGEVCDTKFCLFTRRRHKDDVADPQMIFADSVLLQDHCPGLDDILNGKTDYKIVTGHNIPSRAHHYDYESDSDLDSDSDGLEGSTRPMSSPKRMSDRETLRLRGDERAIVIDDIAFQTWKSFLVYIYTKEIAFQRLTSNRTPNILTSSPPEEPTVACSPKSMYRLASKIGSQELQTLALSAIHQHLSKDNIIEELFCRFTSRYPQVQKIEVDYLIKHLTPTLFGTLAEKLKSIVAGQLPHCHDVLIAVMHKMQFGGDPGEISPLPGVEATVDLTDPPRSTPALAVPSDFTFSSKKPASSNSLLDLDKTFCDESPRYPLSWATPDVSPSPSAPPKSSWAGFAEVLRKKRVRELSIKGEAVI